VEPKTQVTQFLIHLNLTLFSLHTCRYNGLHTLSVGSLRSQLSAFSQGNGLRTLLEKKQNVDLYLIKRTIVKGVANS
jgi:hypothetical protein